MEIIVNVLPTSTNITIIKNYLEFKMFILPKIIIQC